MPRTRLVTFLSRLSSSENMLRDVRRSLTLSTHALTSAPPDHAAAHDLHLAHHHRAMAALDASRRDSADNDAQERAVQHLKQSEGFRNEAKRLRAQTSLSSLRIALPSFPDEFLAPPHTGRPHRLHHAESAAADATHEVQRAKDEVDRAQADHHRDGSAESAHHLWEAERRHRLAQAASDHAHRRLKRQQHKMAVEGVPAKLLFLDFPVTNAEIGRRRSTTA